MIEDYDDGSAYDAAYDAGFWSPDEIDELRSIIASVGELKPVPGDRAMAALILIATKLNQPGAPPNIDNILSPPPEDPTITWARNLLETPA